MARFVTIAGKIVPHPQNSDNTLEIYVCRLFQIIVVDKFVEKNNLFSLAAEEWQWGMSESGASNEHVSAGLVLFFISVAWSTKQIR